MTVFAHVGGLPLEELLPGLAAVLAVRVVGVRAAIRAVVRPGRRSAAPADGAQPPV